MDGPGEQPSNSIQQSRNTDGTDDDESIASNDAENSSAGIPLRSIKAVAAHVPFIEDARAKVTNEMESMVLTGLTSLVRIYLQPYLAHTHFHDWVLTS